MPPYVIYPLNSTHNVTFIIELVNGITIDVMTDKKVRIISDGALFIVMTKEHSKEYPELEFWGTDFETLEIYDS